MTEASQPDPEQPDGAVLAYLAAIEARRKPPETLPHPDEPGPALAGAAMMHGEEGDDLAEDLSAWTPGSSENIDRLEAGFVAAAPDYGRRHQVTYEGWIAAGVDPAVLEKAGIRPEDRTA
ncbi:MAG: hypothetical protein ABR540_06945 [Acidimicrobiales bacterium]